MFDVVEHKWRMAVAPLQGFEVAPTLGPPIKGTAAEDAQSCTSVKCKNHTSSHPGLWFSFFFSAALSTKRTQNKKEVKNRKNRGKEFLLKKNRVQPLLSTLPPVVSTHVRRGRRLHRLPPARARRRALSSRPEAALGVARSRSLRLSAGAFAVRPARAGAPQCQSQNALHPSVESQPTPSRCSLARASSRWRARRPRHTARRCCWAAPSRAARLPSRSGATGSLRCCSTVPRRLGWAGSALARSRAELSSPGCCSAWTGSYGSTRCSRTSTTATVR